MASREDKQRKGETAQLQTESKIQNEAKTKRLLLPVIKETVRHFASLDHYVVDIELKGLELKG